MEASNWMRDGKEIEDNTAGLNVCNGDQFTRPTMHGELSKMVLDHAELEDACLYGQKEDCQPEI